MGVLRIRLSSRRRIPIFRLEGTGILDQEWYPHQFLSMTRAILETRNWKGASDKRKVEHSKYGLVLDLAHAKMFIHESSVWEKWYAPISMRGKDVLDVGAGCGETAHFYFKKGARKVICVEPDKMAVECLAENAVRHAWDIEIVPEPFRVEMLTKYRFDFMKMDGEGCEKQLLQLKELPTPSVVEAHSPQVTEGLTRQFGARIVAKVAENVSLVYIARGRSESD